MELPVVQQRVLQRALPGVSARAGDVPARVGGREARPHSVRGARRARMRRHVGAHHVERYHDGLVRIQVEKEFTVILLDVKKTLCFLSTAFL